MSIGNVEVFVGMTKASMDSIPAPCQSQYKSIVDHCIPAMYSLNIPKSNVQIPVRFPRISQYSGLSKVGHFNEPDMGQDSKTKCSQYL